MEFISETEEINSNLKILLNVVISKLNFLEIPEIINFANQYKNIESVNILKMLPRPKNYAEIKLNDQELEKFKTILTDLKQEEKLLYAGNWLDDPEIKKKEKNLFSHLSEIFKSKKEKRCFTNYYIVSINANGDITQCPQYQETIGKANIKQKRLTQLWEQELLDFRKKMAKNAPCYEECCTILKEQNKQIENFLNQK